MIKKLHNVIFSLLASFFLASGGSAQTIAMEPVNYTAPGYSLSAVPNPFNDQLSLNINVGNKNLTQLKIYDLIGKEVTSINLDGKSGTHSYRVDAANLRPGIYFCTVYSDKGIVETIKLFKTNE
jgi:Secretion system C-terminal sorting domain